MTPRPWENPVFLRGGAVVRAYITQTLYTSNKILYLWYMENKISDFVEGLYVKDGRLINGRPNSMMGIEKAARMKSEVKRQKNIEEISQGIQRAKMMERFMD